MNVDEIVARARAETGLTDIGEPDIVPRLRRVVDCFEREAHLSPMGVAAETEGLVRIVSNRLRVQEQFRRHPEILKEPIRGPVIITGLPRSGTTKLLRMLAADARFQKLPLWRILHPVPLREGPGETEERIAIAEQLSTVMRTNFPDFYAGHPMNALEPDEEEWLLDMVMLGYVNSHAMRTPSWEQWMDRQDFRPWYRYLRGLLQLLQWQDGARGRPWLLKAPSHLQHMKLLFEEFPDATVVHCHRDPVTTITSLAALIEASRRMYSDLDAPAEVGEFTLRHWAMQMRKYADQRAQLERSHRFVDIAYRDITGDLVPAANRIYEAAGIPFTADARDSLHRWNRDNPPGKHGQHRYTMERYGLTAEAIRAGFAGYLTRFGDFI